MDRPAEIVRLFTERSPVGPQPSFWFNVYTREVCIRLLGKLKLTPMGCLEYQGYRNPKGYGHFHLKGVTMYAHRVMASFVAGRLLASNEVAMHKCDNPKCCHPQHLLIGDLKANVEDMDAKGRRATRKGRSRKLLTPQEVLEIKLALVWGEQSTISVAIRFGIGETTARNIRDGYTWKSIKLPEKPSFAYDPFADE